jgi:hypothetical protein
MNHPDEGLPPQAVDRLVAVCAAEDPYARHAALAAALAAFVKNPSLVRDDRWVERLLTILRQQRGPR